MKNMEESDGDNRSARPSFFKTFFVSVEYVSSRFLDVLAEDFGLIRREAHLFFGAVLFLLGLLNWTSAKYCDGNSSDYLSCTRPTVYYYYGSFEIVLMLLGTALVLLWWVRRNAKK